MASGKESNYYLDLKPTMFHPEGAVLLADLIWQRISGMDVDYLGGLEMGAVPLITAVSMASAQHQKPLQGFFVRKQIKDHGTKKKIEAIDDLSGKNIVILDDVTTSGDSAMEAVTAVQNEGANVLLVLAVVDREEGAEKLYKKAGIPFEALFTASDFLNSA